MSTKFHRVFTFQPRSLPLVQSLSLSPCRFLHVRPASVEDERLLVGIVAFLNAYFKQMSTDCASDPEDKDLRWILQLLLNQVQIIYTFWTSSKEIPDYNSPVRFWLEGIRSDVFNTNWFKLVWLWYRCSDYSAPLYCNLAWLCACVYVLVKYPCVHLC